MMLLALQAFLDGGLDLADHVGLGGVLCKAYGALDRCGVRAAMTDQNQSIHAQQDGGSLFARVEQLPDAA